MVKKLEAFGTLFVEYVLIKPTSILAPGYITIPALNTHTKTLTYTYKTMGYTNEIISNRYKIYFFKYNPFDGAWESAINQKYDSL